MFTHIHFQPLAVTDIERARDFYRDKLGLTVDTDEPYGDSRWVFMKVGDSPTMLQFFKQPSIPKSSTPSLILATDDVDKTCEKLKARGVPIKQGPADAPWRPGTRWAMIDDSEGNLVLIQTI
jgi:predicted enzyme related to lactoylglutathione lyase